MRNIQEFFTIYKQSAWEKDVNAMIELYHDNVMIFDMWQHGYQKGLKEWSAAIQDWFDSLKVERVNVDFEMIEVHESGDAGFASAVVIFQAVSGDDKILRSMKNRITLGLIREGHVWRVKHQHTSAPIDSNLQAVLNF